MEDTSLVCQEVQRVDFTISQILECYNCLIISLYLMAVLGGSYDTGHYSEQQGYTSKRDIAIAFTSVKLTCTSLQTDQFMTKFFYFPYRLIICFHVNMQSVQLLT